MRTMTVREFIRGAYRTVREPVQIVANARVLGTWTPTDRLDEVLDEPPKIEFRPVPKPGRKR